MSAAPCKCFYCHYKQPETPTTHMQPCDETAERQAFERARRLVESYGYVLTMPESVNIEGDAK